MSKVSCLGVSVGGSSTLEIRDTEESLFLGKRHCAKNSFSPYYNRMR